MLIAIRLAAPADVPLLVELNRTIQALHVGQRSDLFKEPEPRTIADWFAGKLASSNVRIWIAEADEEPVGYLLAVSQRRAEGPFTHARQCVEVDQVVVLLSHRRRGIARRLLEMAAEDASIRQLGDLELTSWQFNTEAHAAFRALGFKAQVTRFRRPGS
ncbi:MAG: GNAT family N-acetyltransferase [Gemmatimonadaceae bacterium]